MLVVLQSPTRICELLIHFLIEILRSDMNFQWVFLPRYNFLTSYLIIWKILTFSELCRSPRCWHTPLYNMKKIVSTNITTNLIRRILKNWGNAKLTSSRYKFFKILIFAPTLKFYHWHQVLSVVFLEVTGLLCSFFLKESVCQDLTTSVPVSHFFKKKKDCSTQKWLVQLTAQMAAQVLASLGMQDATFYVCIPFGHIKCFKCMCPQGSRFNKIHTAYCLLINIKEISFPPAWVWCQSRQWQLRSNVLIYSEALAVRATTAMSVQTLT